MFQQAPLKIAIAVLLATVRFMPAFSKYLCLFFIPDFTFGQVYGFTNDMVGELLEAAAKPRPDYIPVDEVFVTGILRENIGARIWDWTSLIRYWPFDREFEHCKIVLRQNTAERSTSFYDTHQRNKLGFYAWHADWGIYTKTTSDGNRSLGECYSEQHPPHTFVVVVLGEDALGMAELWEKVLKQRNQRQTKLDNITRH